mmetsp:Transcript_34869/g.105127  ORF Transcript_34869/g.105127 Transcript_34869/m.105127 type:complete len:411 (-) Transcript_34869:46-1278(-)
MRTHVIGQQNSSSARRAAIAARTRVVERSSWSASAASASRSRSPMSSPRRCVAAAASAFNRWSVRAPMTRRPPSSSSHVRPKSPYARRDAESMDQFSSGESSRSSAAASSAVSASRSSSPSASSSSPRGEAARGGGATVGAARETRRRHGRRGRGRGRRGRRRAPRRGGGRRRFGAPRRRRPDRRRLRRRHAQGEDEESLGVDAAADAGLRRRVARADRRVVLPGREPVARVPQPRVDRDAQARAALAAAHGLFVLRPVRHVVPAHDPLRLDVHGHAREAPVRGALGLCGHDGVRRGAPAARRRPRRDELAVPRAQPVVLPRVHLGEDVRGPGGLGDGVLQHQGGAAALVLRRADVPARARVPRARLVGHRDRPPVHRRAPAQAAAGAEILSRALHVAASADGEVRGVRG